MKFVRDYIPWDGQQLNYWGASTNLRSTNPCPSFCLGSSDKLLDYEVLKISAELKCARALGGHFEKRQAKLNFSFNWLFLQLFN